MTRRILISTAVMETPRLVIADEPTRSAHHGGPAGSVPFPGDRGSGAGVLLITHDLELALDTADRIVVFYAGTNLEEADSRISPGSRRCGTYSGRCFGLCRSMDFRRLRAPSHLPGSCRRAVPTGRVARGRRKSAAGRCLTGNCAGKGEVRAGGMADGAG